MHKQLIGITLTSGVALGGVLALTAQQPSARAIASQTVTINFAAQVGDEAFACGETYSLGSADTPATAMDFRFYVSQVALLDADGNETPLVLQQDGKWQHQDVALLDFENRTGACANGTPETRTQVVGSVPAGDYIGLKFTLGVPFNLNHIDSTLAPSPLNLTAMWWNWNFGYKFARIDLMPTMDMARVRHEGHGSGHGEHSAQSQAFAIHLGSVGCQMDAAEAPVVCSIPNRSEVVFTSFDPAEDVVVADLAALLGGTNLSENEENTAVGCMSSPDDSDCAGIMQSLGLPFNEQPATGQNFFTVE
ncbi:MAG: MbnP family copper-binding protein [Cyanobacteria bacterium P01_H01_bin.119]